MATSDHFSLPGPVCSERYRELAAEHGQHYIDLMGSPYPPCDLPGPVGTDREDIASRHERLMAELHDAQPQRDEQAGSAQSGKSEQHKERPIPDNVRQFVLKHYQEAQTLAKSLGHGVTAAEVLAISGMESGWGNAQNATQLGNFFGIHGTGTQGSEPAARDPSVKKAKYSINNGYYESGQAFVKTLGPHLTGNVGNDPIAFF